jgi:hypothetical protein
MLWAVWLLVNGQVTLRTENHAYAISYAKKHQDSSYSGTDIVKLLILAKRRIITPLKHGLIISTIL